MHAAGRAILWQISWRARYGLLAAGAYLVLAMILTQVLPNDLRIQMNDEAVPAVAWFLGMPGVLINILLVAVFLMTGHDAKDSGFTTHMFVLPVRTTTLVAWPMFSGCLFVITVWLVTAGLVFRPGGIEAPLLWPGAALAAFLAVFQAVTWTPFAQRWIQLALLIVMITSPIAAMPVLILLDIQMSEPMMALLSISIVPVAYVAAVSGVSRARSGDPYDWRLWSRVVEWITTRRSRARRPFSSWWTAQLWFECRTHVWTLPIFLGSVLLCLMFIPCIERDNVDLGWRLLWIVLAAPMFIAVMVGAVLGNLHDPYSRTDTSTFVLTRPISCASIVKGKLIAAAVCTAITWVLMLAFGSLLLLRPGFVASIVEVASHFPTWKAVGVPLLMLALLVAFTWKNMIENLWVMLSGRKWVEAACMYGCVALVMMTLGAGLWIYFHPALHAPARAAVPWLIGLLLFVKALLAISILRGLTRSRLIRRPAAALLLGGWSAVVLGLCLLACLLVPGQAIAWTTLVPSIALLVPFSRLAAAPLALAWNRHR